MVHEFRPAARRRQAVREFFIGYQDRILFGTDVDLEQPQSTMSPEERARSLRALRKAFQAAAAYFGSGEIVAIRERRVQGLDLPGAVLGRLYLDNARRWYPELAGDWRMSGPSEMETWPR